MRRVILIFVLAMTFAGANAIDIKGSVALGDSTYKAYTDSMTQIGDMHFFETGDFEKAVRYYAKAYEKGGVEAALMLGRCCAEGLGLEFDRGMAFMLWSQAAAAGNVDAMLKVAECYLYGNGVKENMAESFQWYSRAHTNGAVEAAFVLGAFYHGGTVVEKDEEKALKYWKEAADYGIKSAQEALGMEYYEGKNTKRNIIEALKYLKMAADQGAPKAAFYAGLCCEKSYGMPYEDYVSAAYYYMVAADAEIPEAQVRLANLYLQGLGVDQNTERANYWFMQAQKNGLKIKVDE